jgi:hypothetical protein
MPCLSSQPEFGIAQVEVWGCIPGYVADESELEAAGVKRKNAKTYQDYQNQTTGVLDFFGCFFKSAIPVRRAFLMLSAS